LLIANYCFLLNAIRLHPPTATQLPAEAIVSGSVKCLMFSVYC